jgi:hypothetical protein
MCNLWCLEFVQDTLKFWKDSPIVLEVGSKNVNGTVRSICEPGSLKYIGVDIETGDGVDIIVDAYELTKYFGLDVFDVVISTEMVEHVLDWPLVFCQMMSVLKQGGLLILTTRSIGF